MILREFVLNSLSLTKAFLIFSVFGPPFALRTVVASLAAISPKVRSKTHSLERFSRLADDCSLR
jgi:hypothetical protein